MRVGGGGQQANAGRGIVQAGSINNSVIYQLIDTVQTPADIDLAIAKAGEHLQRLRKQKGLHDGRIPLAVIGAICVMVGLSIGWPQSMILYVGSAALIFCSYKLNSKINTLDSEIAAAQSLLTEFFKIKLQQQLSPKTE